MSEEQNIQREVKNGSTPPSSHRKKKMDTLSLGIFNVVPPTASSNSWIDSLINKNKLPYTTEI